MLALLDRLATTYLRWRTRQSMRAHGMSDAEANALITHANMSEHEIQAVAEHPAIAILADEINAFYDKLAGPNYLELKFWGPKGPLVLVASRPGPGVKTQHDLVLELKTENARLRDEPAVREP